jgi:hypothetical protein
MNFVLEPEVEKPKLIQLKLTRNDKGCVVLEARSLGSSIGFNIITFKEDQVIIDEFGHAKNKFGIKFKHDW